MQWPKRNGDVLAIYIYGTVIEDAPPAPSNARIAAGSSWVISLHISLSVAVAFEVVLHIKVTLHLTLLVNAEIE